MHCPRLRTRQPAEEISKKHGLRNKVQGRIISAVIANLSIVSMMATSNLLCISRHAHGGGENMARPQTVAASGLGPHRSAPLPGSGLPEGWVCPVAEFSSLSTQGSRRSK